MWTMLTVSLLQILIGGAKHTGFVEYNTSMTESNIKLRLIVNIFDNKHSTNGEGYNNILVLLRTIWQYDCNIKLKLK